MLPRYDRKAGVFCRVCGRNGVSAAENTNRQALAYGAGGSLAENANDAEVLRFETLVSAHVVLAKQLERTMNDYVGLADDFLAEVRHVLPDDALHVLMAGLSRERQIRDAAERMAGLASRQVACEQD